MIEPRLLGRTGLSTSALGLGGSRLGSLLAGDPRDAARAVAAARDAGIRFFDSADIYGQGDSERLIGAALDGVADVVIATKAGYRLPAPAWALRLAKPLLRPLLRRRPASGGAIATRRRRGFAHCFEPAHLRRALEGSLRRLRRERVELFLLHSPPPALAEDEALWRLVEDLTRDGLIGAFGVSCAGTAADMAWLRRPAVAAVQIPWYDAGLNDAFVRKARHDGVAVIAREILAGAAGADAVGARLQAALSHPDIDVALVGMSRADHVRANAALAARLAARPAAAVSA